MNKIKVEENVNTAMLKLYSVAARANFSWEELRLYNELLAQKIISELIIMSHEEE